MKTARKLIPAFVLAAITGPAHAYYLTNAVPGTASIEVTGACAIAPTTSKAYLANVHDDERNLLGWGIVTASGQLIALRQDRFETRYQQDYASGEQRAVEYIDMTGKALENVLAFASGGCTVARLQPGIDSRVSYSWNGGHGRANLKATFAGFEGSRCNELGDSRRCKAQKFSGSITFRGNW